ncbi:MAG: hypothetical protein ACYSWW_20505 [Planctomycetota bacterium]
MKKFKVTLLVVVAYLLIAPSAVYAAKINFPDILGYKTLKCDFHMHTVFSDGQVWPTTRVDEHNRPYRISAAQRRCSDESRPAK